MLSKHDFTHYGWFYFVPVYFNEKTKAIIMRPFMLWWPVAVAIWLHNLVSNINGNYSDFPIMTAGEIQPKEQRE